MSACPKCANDPLPYQQGQSRDGTVVTCSCGYTGAAWGERGIVAHATAYAAAEAIDAILTPTEEQA